MNITNHRFYPDKFDIKYIQNLLMFQPYGSYNRGILHIFSVPVIENEDFINRETENWCFLLDEPK